MAEEGIAPAAESEQSDSGCSREPLLTPTSIPAAVSQLLQDSVEQLGAALDLINQAALYVGDVETAQQSREGGEGCELLGALHAGGEVQIELGSLGGFEGTEKVGAQ